MYIVYYASIEDKTFLPWSVNYFSPYPGRKYHIRVFEPGAIVALSGR